VLNSDSEIKKNAQNYFCVYRHVGAKSFTESSKKTYLLRYYPVAVQKLITRTGPEGTLISEYLIVPGIMAMVVWE